MERCWHAAASAGGAGAERRQRRRLSDQETAHDMINDSILIVLISVFTALLGEGQFRESLHNKFSVFHFRLNMAAGLPDGQVPEAKDRSGEAVQET